MTMDDYRELAEYWADHPPVHVMVAAYMGVKPRKKASVTTDEGAELFSLLGCDPNNGGTMRLLH